MLQIQDNLFFVAAIYPKINNSPYTYSDLINSNKVKLGKKNYIRTAKYLYQQLYNKIENKNNPIIVKLKHELQIIYWRSHQSD